MARRTVDLDELVAAHEQLQAAMDAMADALPVTMVGSGRRIVTSLRIAPEMLVRLKVAAAHEHVRVNELILNAIRDHLELLERRHQQGEAA